MSNVSGTSIASQSSRSRGRIFGVPKKCVCGQQIVELILKSEANSYRRYYRCSYAAANKLRNDNHTFKWVDDAYLNEIESMDTRIARLEEHVEDCKTETNEMEKMVFERLHMKIEKEIFEKVDDVLAEEKSKMKKIMIALVVGCVLIVAFIQFLG